MPWWLDLSFLLQLFARPCYLATPLRSFGTTATTLTDNMAAEAFPLLTSDQHSADKAFEDNLAFQLVNEISPGNSVISLSFVTASKICGNNFEQLKARVMSVSPFAGHPRYLLLLTTNSDYFRDQLNTPVLEIDLKVDQAANTVMAVPTKVASPSVAGEAATSPASDASQDELRNSGSFFEAKKKKVKVPRPPNAFIIYRKEWHPIMVQQNPGLHNNAICKCSWAPTFRHFTDIV